MAMVDASLEVEQLIDKRAANPHISNDNFVEVPEDVEEPVWKYELLRYFTVQLSDLAVQLSEECSADTCPDMRASEEWQFLCACHSTPQECSAISYMMHNLQQAENTLAGERFFESRLRVSPAGMKQVDTYTRRLYRILAHAYFQHRSCFDAFEAKTRIHGRYHAFATRFHLISKEHLIIPAP
ncbi:hypothetical protein PTSG_02564 [Salpingoeca rosetta]|uniref:Mob1/phocein family protein n=1 Tax=Salpingoeca rosetta (strain ATCC 50818 / BSB-021) TaxID=946362 RepID=F2U2N3_SALR5|nr:uncharacterized protein PTSG_02564 [Salpingoeca rosetta]EGD81877.1 hypothetical protein PTSG_02564 [Salpingoeca rosetta]|eukprot:XP_004996060.1 hypothetical protein PTSG_02564 [Salpingoeca rosetta]